MQELNQFYNAGLGWICKRCEQELNQSPETNAENLPRVWREGEAESKQICLSAPLAKWNDAARRQLICPRCGVTEIVDQT